MGFQLDLQDLRAEGRSRVRATSEAGAKCSWELTQTAGHGPAYDTPYSSYFFCVLMHAQLMSCSSGARILKKTFANDENGLVERKERRTHELLPHSSMKKRKRNIRTENQGEENETHERLKTKYT